MPSYWLTSRETDGLKEPRACCAYPRVHAMSAFQILKSLNLLNWPVILLGWERGWVTPFDVEDYAIGQLQGDVPDDLLRALAMLESARSLESSEVTRWLQELVAPQCDIPDVTLAKWRLARLLELQAKQLDWDDSMNRLEVLVRDFDYPADMRRCSRYISAGEQPPYVDPLVEMQNVIDQLKNRFGVDGNPDLGVAYT